MRYLSVVLAAACIAAAGEARAAACANPPVIGWEEGGFPPFPEIGTGRIEIQYHDQCGQENLTVVYGRRSTSSTWTILRVDGYDSVGWRRAVYQDLDPGTSYCFKVQTTKDNVTKTSAERCTTTQPFYIQNSDHALIREVHGLKVASGAELGKTFTPSATRSYRFQVTGEPNTGCRGVAVRDAKGNLMAYNFCNQVTVNLDAGRTYAIYGIGAETGEGQSPTCSLLIDGAASGSIPCGWNAIALGTFQQGEVLEAVHLPPTSKLPPLDVHPAYAPPMIRMVVLPIAGSNSLIKPRANGTAGGAKATIDGNFRRALVLLAFDSNADLSQPVRLVRNDAALVDTDGDGLGDQLEAALQTWPFSNAVVGGFECTTAYDPRDTDGDGLSDLWEVLGRKKPAGIQGKDQPLPYWGANPRHKDLFQEVDFAKKTQNAPPLRVTSEEAMAAAKRWSMGGVSDEERREFNARDLENPDLLPGISVHYDTGVWPSTPAEWLVFGDLGGHDDLPLFDPNRAEWPWYQPIEAWRLHFEEIRHGIFKHMLTYDEGGGKAGWGPTGSIGITESTAKVSRNMVHETGHMLGLSHGGPNLMNSVVPGYDPEPGGGPNCKPMYLSLMNYAAEHDDEHQTYESFADDYVINFTPMNNLALVEENALGYYRPSTLRTPESDAVVIDFLKYAFGFHVDSETGSVDWNRDGVISTEPVRAGANLTGGECEQGRINRTTLPTTSYGTKGLSLERYDGFIHALWVQGSTLHWMKIEVDRECTDRSGGACVRTFTHPYPVSMAASGGASLERIEYMFLGQMQSWLGLAVLHEAENVIRLRFYHPSLGWGALHTIYPVLPNGVTLTLAGEPYLVRTRTDIPDVTVGKLFFKSADGRIFMVNIRVKSNGAFTTGAIEPVMTDDGAQVMTDEMTSPSAIYSTDYNAKPKDLTSSSPKYLHLFTRSNAVTQIFRLPDAVGTTFEEAGTVSLDYWVGRPSPVFVTFSDDDAAKGALYLYVANATGQMKYARWMGKYLRVNRSWIYQQKFQPSGLVDTMKGYAIAALYDHGVDEQPRLLVAGPNQTMEIRPRPENIFDFDYYGYNDWLTLRYTICHQVSKSFENKVNELFGGPAVSCRPYPSEDPTHNRGF